MPLGSLVFLGYVQKGPKPLSSLLGLSSVALQFALGKLCRACFQTLDVAVSLQFENHIWRLTDYYYKICVLRDDTRTIHLALHLLGGDKFNVSDTHPKYAIYK